MRFVEAPSVLVSVDDDVTFAAWQGAAACVYALQVCLICMPYMYALQVCLICMPYMYALYVCLRRLVEVPSELVVPSSDRKKKTEKNIEWEVLVT